MSRILSYDERYLSQDVSSSCWKFEILETLSVFLTLISALFRKAGPPRSRPAPSWTTSTTRSASKTLTPRNDYVSLKRWDSVGWPPETRDMHEHPLLHTLVHTRTPSHTLEHPCTPSHTLSHPCTHLPSQTLAQTRKHLCTLSQTHTYEYARTHTIHWYLIQEQWRTYGNSCWTIYLVTV